MSWSSREPDRDGVECRATLSSLVAERVAVVTLLDLEHERALPLERRAPAQVRGRNRLAAPRVHGGTPGRVHGETGERSERDQAGSRTVIAATGRRFQLFSPSPETNGSTSRSPIATAGPISNAGVSSQGGNNESTA